MDMNTAVSLLNIKEDLLDDEVNISSTSLDDLKNNINNDAMKNELNDFLLTFNHK